MALRRSLPLNRAIELEEILIEGVRVANEKREELSKKLLENSLVRIGDKLLDRYLNMYASNDSIELSELQIKALDRLWEIGYKNGVYDSLIKTEEYLIPREYKGLRYS